MCVCVCVFKYILRYHAHVCCSHSGASAQVPRRDHGPSERRKNAKGSCKAGSLVVLLRVYPWVHIHSPVHRYHPMLHASTGMILQGNRSVLTIHCTCYWLTVVVYTCFYRLVCLPFCFCCWSCDSLNMYLLVCTQSVCSIIRRTAIGHNRAGAGARKSAYGMLTRTK